MEENAPVPNSEFSFTSPRKQLFPFPYNYMDYILKRPLSPFGLQKLYQTCKYFFSKHPILIFFNETHYNGEKYLLQRNPVNRKPANSDTKLWFCGFLTLHLLSFSRLEKIYRCTITALTILESTLTIKEFDLLVTGNDIKSFDLSGSSIVYPDGSNVPITEILAKVPNIYRFWYSNTKEKFTAETLRKLNEVQLNTKLEFCSLWLWSVDRSFDPLLLCQFIEKNAKKASSFQFTIKGYNNEEVARSLNQSINNMESWRNGKIFAKVFLR
uniref:F-box associated domain-containing protein n=1 Tax=Panagrolaimus superbus TaxID=310955 RepID=A0A914YW45_9BILA